MGATVTTVKERPVSDILTVAEVAKLMGLTHQQVLNRIHRGKIKAEKKGWFWLVDKKSLPTKQSAEGAK